MLGALEPLGCHELVYKEVFQFIVAHPAHGIFKRRRRGGAFGSLRNHRCAHGQSVKGTRLLEAAAFIEVAVENGFGLPDELVAFFAEQRMVKSRDAPTTGFDAFKNLMAPFVDAAKKQQINGAIFHRQAGCAGKVGRVLERDDGDIPVFAAIGCQVARVIVHHRGRTQQVNVSLADDGTILTQLFKIEKDAGETLFELRWKAQMRAKDDVDGIFTKPVFSEGHLSTQLTKLVADITCLIQKAQGVDIAWGLNDAQMYAMGHGALSSKVFGR